MIRRKIRRFKAAASRFGKIVQRRTGRFGRFLFSTLWTLCTFGWLKAAGRKWTNLVAGIPVLLVIIGVGYLVISSSLRSDNDLRGTYVASAFANAQSGQHENATLMFQRAMEIRPLNDPALFQFALSAFEIGEIAKGNTILQRLAPDDEPRHADAHFWRAVQILSEKKLTLSEVDSAEKQLRHTLTLQPNHENARATLGKLYFETQRPRLATNEFAQSVKSHPELLLPYAKCLALQDRATEAKYQGELALQWMINRLREESSNLELLYEIADCHAFLKQYDRAAAILEQLIQKSPNERKYSVALASVYVDWETSLVGESEQEDRKRFQLLSRALSIYPDNPLLFSRLMHLVDDRNDVSEDLMQFLHQNIAQGHAMGLSHLILGSSGFLTQDSGPAALHLERAYELMPNAPVVANNLAWHLLTKDPAEPERAMEIIQPVIARSPNLIEARDTRGMAYLELGEWRKAVSDLEFAVNNGLRQSSSTHAGLAKAYEKLGQTALAKEHKRLAEQFAR